MDVQEKAEYLVSEVELCDHCLGRQFARLGHGLENWERGLLVRDHLGQSKELDEDSFVRENIPDKEPRREPCSVCDGLFTELDTYEKRVVNALDRYEFDTYLIGCRPPNDVVQAEEELWEQVGVEWVEPLKSEVNRLIGKRVAQAIDEDVDVNFERPDINAVMDIGKDHVELQVNSMLIYGQYNKYSRELPQTKWPCGNCRGKGCEECDWTGKQYLESVEELIAEPFKEETRALESKFHGAGREDVDAKCLGRREFVLELVEPETRDIDLDALQEEVNERHGDKVEVFDLKWAEKDMVEAVKSRRANKTYRARIQLEDDVSDEELEQLSRIVGTIQQQTPTRVEHRRADKTRERDVLDISWERVGPDEIELEVAAEAGTYIKELISSDDEKTKPSVSQVLGTDAECTELDVIDIEKPAELVHTA